MENPIKKRLRLMAEYQEQFPNEENPFDWAETVDMDEIVDFVEKRNGRKVVLVEDKENPLAFDLGVLQYAQA